MSEPRELVGRASELETLCNCVQEASRGRGTLSFVCGEAGIGKSRLLDELANRAPGEVRVLWGRCWEAGGASAYWPWIQLLRDLLSDDQQLLERINPYVAAHLAQLIPELRSTRPNLPEPPRLDPEQARFELLDAVARVLSTAACQRPLLLLLEDLHAADPSSLLLLEFVGRQLHTAPMAVVGTYRAAEAAGRACGPSLSRVSQQGRLVSLHRLGVTEVESLLADIVGPTLAQRVAADVHRTTEGNPLFLVELGRLMASHDRHEDVVSTARGATVPLGLRMAIAQRLDGLSDRARGALALSSVVGREFNGAAVSVAFERDEGELRTALEEAVQAAILTRAGPDCYRYSHILVREVIYQGIEPARRQRLHLRMADLLKRNCERDPSPRWTEAAHHYLEAGTPGWLGAIETSTRAAEQALTKHAHDEAIAAYKRALGALERAPAELEPVHRIDLLIGLGRAQLVHGDIDEGQQTCLRAAGLARSAALPELLSCAALAYGSVFVFAHVDETLVSLLQESLAALSAHDSSLRARVMARLAAALQPALDPEGPIDMARRAIEMARRVGDPECLLATLRAGCSSMVDLVVPELRKPLNQEHIALADALRDLPEAFRGAVRLAFDCLELGERDEAREAMARVQELAATLGHPYFAWRAKAFQAARELWSGHIDQAARAIDETAELAMRGRDPNASFAILVLRSRLLCLQGNTDELASLLPQLARMFEDTPGADPLARVYAHGFRLEVGLAPDVLPAITPETKNAALGLGDRTVVFALARIAVEQGDVTLARRVLDRLSEDPEHLITGGVLGMTWDGPRHWPMALIADMLGDHTDADRWFTQAANQARSLEGEAVWACIQADYLASMARRGRTDPKLVAEVRALAERQDLRVVAGRLRALDGRRSSSSEPHATVPRMEAPMVWSLRREGDYWTVCCGDSTFRLRHVKGMEILAQLVDCPGRSFHVLDLAYPGREFQEGESDTLIDRQARASYGRRIRALREELAEAESDHDLGRAQRAREELTFLEQQVAEAIGLGGRHRKAKDASERARVNVQRRLRDAIRRIEENHERLGQHLLLHVRTGTFCHYE